jgi:nicotinamidase-related amidase
VRHERIKRVSRCRATRFGARSGHVTLRSRHRFNDVDTVVVAGCNYPNCPRTSIYEASERDYRVVLVEDAVSGLYERGRAEMTNIGVTLCRYESVIALRDNTPPDCSHGAARDALGRGPSDDWA